MKKSMVLAILVGALCVIILSCGTSGGGGGGGAAGEASAGNWVWEPITEFSDGNDSTCFMVEADETIDGQAVHTYAFSGEVTNTIQYGLSNWRITPADDATLELLKTCTAISFKMIGDGKTYQVELVIPTVTDWGYHVRNIRTEAGQVMEHTLPIRSFTQPGWATAVRFNQSTLEYINIKTRNNAEGGLGPYSVKMWDLQLYK